MRIATALGLAMAIGGMWATPAFGEDNRDHPRQEQRGQNRGPQHPSGNQEHRSDWHGNQRHDHRGGYSHGYDNQGYVYAPPPVAYVPQPSPGITLIFPLQFR